MDNINMKSRPIFFGEEFKQFAKFCSIVHQPTGLPVVTGRQDVANLCDIFKTSNGVTTISNPPSN